MDDTSDEELFVKKTVSGLLDQGAIALLGPVGSQQVVAVYDMVVAKQVIQISSSATSPDLSAKLGVHDRYFFRTVPPDDLQGKALVQFALRGPPGAKADGGMMTAGCKKMAVVHIDNSYGNSLSTLIGQYLPTKGGSVVVDVKIPPKRVDNYKDQVNQIAAKAPDCMAPFAFSPAPANGRGLG